MLYKEDKKQHHMMNSYQKPFKINLSC